MSVVGGHQDSPVSTFKFQYMEFYLFTSPTGAQQIYFVDFVTEMGRVRVERTQYRMWGGGN